MVIFLVGYMGSGKSSFGKKLALKLHLQFLDLDSYIEEQSQTSITEIFDKKGEAHFRSLEHEAIKKLTEENNLIIATGGGTPCFYANMDLMNKYGITVYLQGTVELLVSRLAKSKKERPLLKNKTEEELKNFIAKSLLDREIFYAKSKYIMDAKNANADQLAMVLQHK